MQRRELQGDCGQQMSRREGRGRGYKTWWSREYMYIWEVLGRRGSGISLGGGEGAKFPWEKEREWEFLGRRRGSGKSLGGGEGVGSPWEEEREWKVLGRVSVHRHVLSFRLMSLPLCVVIVSWYDGV